MQVIVAGATGFVGRHLIRELLQNNDKVVVVSRNADAAYSNLPAEVSVIPWDNSRLRDAVAHADAVINLAGEPIAGSKWNSKKKAAILNSRLHAAQRLRDAIKSTDNNHLTYIQASAVGFYGNAGEKLCHEHDIVGKGFLAQVCQKWESYVPEICEKNERAIIIRIGVVLGTEGGFLKEMLKQSERHLAGRLGNGRQWISWIHIHDLVHAIIHLLQDQGAFGAYNLVAPEPIRQRDFSKMLASATGRKLQMPAPAFLVKSILGSMGEELILSGQKVSSAKLEKLGFAFRFREIQKALNDLIL